MTQYNLDVAQTNPYEYLNTVQQDVFKHWTNLELIVYLLHKKAANYLAAPPIALW